MDGGGWRRSKGLLGRNVCTRVELANYRLYNLCFDRDCQSERNLTGLLCIARTGKSCGRQPIQIFKVPSESILCHQRELLFDWQMLSTPHPLTCSRSNSCLYVDNLLNPDRTTHRKKYFLNILWQSRTLRNKERIMDNYGVPVIWKGIHITCKTPLWSLLI